MRHLSIDRLDRHLLSALAGPLALCLGVLLVAQLLGRLLRLFDMAASVGAGVGVVFSMAATLVPHYLGLALPSAFFAAIFIAIARLGDDNEIDVMLATGRSIGRIALPYFAVAMAMTMFNFYLFGFLQPLSRYAYNLAAHNVVKAGWNARVEDKRFFNTGRGYLLSSDSSGASGRDLSGVFVARYTQGREEIITAPSGQLVPSADGTRLSLHLADGLIVRDEIDGGSSVVGFAQGDIDEDFTTAPPPYRARGESVRELTFVELREPAVRDNPRIDVRRDAQRRAGEFNGRIARSLVPTLLPLMALPLGMAAKRGRRAPGIIFATLALIALNQTLQFGANLVQSGRAPSAIAIWLPFLVYALLAGWIFRSSLLWPGDNPIVRAVNLIESAFEGAGNPWRKKTP